jgi:hypothetical protein
MRTNNNTTIINNNPTSSSSSSNSNSNKLSSPEESSSLVQQETTTPFSNHQIQNSYLQGPLFHRISSRCLDHRRTLAITGFITLIFFIIFLSNHTNNNDGDITVSEQTTTSTNTNGQQTTINNNINNESSGDHEESTLFEQLFDNNILDFDETHDIDCNATTLTSLIPGSWQYEVRAADCGAGYDFKNAATKPQNKHLKIALYGPDMYHLVHLSGCPNGGHLQCPWHAGCQFTIANKPGQIKDADVVVVSTQEHEKIEDAIIKKDFMDDKDPGQYRVLYYREAYWPSVPVGIQKTDFDFEMGIHYRAGVLNPIYLRRPRTLLSTSVFPFVPFEHRPNFAMSIISDCHASSQRQIYIDHLSDYLGQHRVHQYGACGNRKLPPPPVTHAAKIISTYKFYLSFENTIQEGYVTEKLMTVLNMGGIVPIYYGAPNVPNITIVPSFINVMDFPSPKALAEYLLFLEKNPKEYAKYNVWRSSPKYFHPEYLRLVQRQMPGQEELLKYRQRGFDKFPRRAACCRLCDLSYIRQSAMKRTDADLPHPKWHPEQINHHVFGGGMNKRPGVKGRLDE